jgi:nucleoside-diphosphate-sugar epimerase
MKKIFLTGSSGFIGRNLLSSLNDSNDFSTTCSVRNNPSVGDYLIPVIDSGTDWADALLDVHCVIHLAALAHGNVKGQHADRAFQEVNVLGTLNLARQAIKSGVERFIFISSIGVNGSKTTVPFTHETIPEPTEIYAKSKYDAEVGLQEICEYSQIELVIIRPPLVYGRDAPGNFGLLSKIVMAGLPLPLMGVVNKRSFVSVWNLVSLITRCIEHENAANKIFLVSDNEVVSTPVLLKKISIAINKPSRLFYIPPFMLYAALCLIGKKKMYNKLFESLEVDDSFTRDTLDWKPPFSLDQGLMKAFDKG